MEIVNKLDKSKCIPVVDILNRIIPLFRSENFVGIRRIVLLDKNYHDQTHARGLYMPIPNTRKADIELYFDYLSKYPPSVVKEEIFLAYVLTETLAHEMYHHIVRGQRRIRKHSDEQEEIDATKWAQGAIRHVFERLYPREHFEDKWNHIKSF